MIIESGLEKTERNAFRSLTHDGRMEIFIGILLLSMAAGTFGMLRFVLIALIVAAAVLLVWAAKRLKRPLAGEVRFGEKKQVDRVRMRGLVLLLLAATLAVGVTLWTGESDLPVPSAWGMFPRQVLAGFVFFIVPFCTLACYLENPLLLIAAAAVFLKSGFHGMFPEPWMEYGICGLGGFLLAAAGAVRLNRFLRDHPKAGPEADHA